MSHSLCHNRESLLSFLQEHEVVCDTNEHPAVTTVEEQAKHVGHLHGALTKNFLLKDMKNRLYIVSALTTTRVDLEALSVRLGLGKDGVNMASEDSLQTVLQVPLGCVTPFALINQSARFVTLLLDIGFQKQSRLFFHSLANDASIALTTENLDKFLKAIGREASYVDLEAHDLANLVPKEVHKEVETFGGSTGLKASFVDTGISAAISGIGSSTLEEEKRLVVVGTLEEKIEALLEDFLTQKDIARDFAKKLVNSGYTLATLLEMSEVELDEIMTEVFVEVSMARRRGFKAAMRFKKRMHGVTPPKLTFRQWLHEHPSLGQGADLESMLKYLETVPCSLETKRFIESNLFQVSFGNDTHFDVLPTPYRDCFWRDDIFNILKEDTSKVLILSGRRRIGKTVAMAHEVVRARHEKYKCYDKVIFYEAGTGGIPGQNLQTVLKVLVHMHIPALWDEFTLLPTIDLAKEYKILLESSGPSVPVLSAVLFGSNESVINDQGRRSFSGVITRGAGMVEVPWPSIALISSMLACREPSLQGYELGARFLEKFTLYGFNLASHMEFSIPETLDGLLMKGVQGLTFLSGSRLEALKRLAAHRNRSDGISIFDLIELERGQYIQKRDGSTHYDFLDPQLVALACVSKGQTLEDAEGRVLELLVRNLMKDSLFMILEREFPILRGLLDSKPKIHHGNLTKHCEVDGLFFHNGCVVLLSCKRSEVFQSWERSFLDHLKHLSLEGLKQCPQVHKELALSKQVILIACSVLGGGSLAMKSNSFYHLMIDGSYQNDPKEVSCMAICLHEMLALLPKIKVTPSSYWDGERESNQPLFAKQGETKKRSITI